MANEQEACEEQYCDSSNLEKRMALFKKDEGENLWKLLWTFYDFKQAAEILEIGSGNGQF